MNSRRALPVDSKKAQYALWIANIREKEPKTLLVFI